MKALVQRELACLNKFSEFPRDCQQGIFNGPGGYRPTKEAKSLSYRTFSRSINASYQKRMHSIWA
jgi:hypothetical protein